MISKTFRIAQMTVLASLALSSAAWATCSNASLSGTYGFLHGGTASDGTPITGLSQVTFDPTTGTYTGEDIQSHDGVITTESLAATLELHRHCYSHVRRSLSDPDVSGSSPPALTTWVASQD